MTEHPHPALRRVSKWLLLLILATQGTACGLLEPEKVAGKNARVVVTGTSSVPLTLITSTKFERTLTDSEEVLITLLEADTTAVTLPSGHDETYPIRPDRRFFVRLVNPTLEMATVSMKVYFDGDLNFDERDVSLTDASIEFSYLFTNF